ncbi:3-hydroxyacyl-CoA dehydrogenase [Corynebacterium sp. 13CS0277]|uniref:3-hydroxyacyl-CoA dehydrogenase/enoyl-CoA hydratase family protein n=1 Tax=Corynebacterium sp. 13CS0277 TaxID=2071994 RepID=UPI000D030C98|nr:3-hydroxyacyl-CoA dehydrogenase/enoyl-CoA hydratase family protein [Corynebacterium sp. 13CS0277]PRQ11641.1 3-hydroxyacyl-CoA dehydrogenase [Corynebacterium sp. 13CS0277]
MTTAATSTQITDRAATPTSTPADIPTNAPAATTTGAEVAPLGARRARCAPEEFTRAAVIGAGSMGSGIAALLASCGMDVVLLDMPEDGPDRSARARRGVDTQLRRGGFTHPSFAQQVTCGNTEDDLELLRDCQWVVEAVFENLEVKTRLYDSIAPYLSLEAVLSSNTSTIPLAQLSATLPEDLARRMVVTHFFNPPRVMNLVEVVAQPTTDAPTVERIMDVIAHQLGKVPLRCRDTPGFIANRVGNLWMAAAARIALDRGIPLTVADAVNQAVFTTPRTGVFGLFDYIGLQLVPDVWGSFMETVPPEDSYHRFPVHNDPLILGLIARGLTGRTGPSGLLRRSVDADGRRLVEVIDPATGEYVEAPPLDEDVARECAAGGEALLRAESAAGEYARAIFAETLYYCAAVAEEICDSVDQIDAALRHGYSWRQGPLALADAYGCEFSVRLVAEHLQRDAAGGQAPREVPALLRRAVAAGGFYPAAGRVLSSTGDVVDEIPTPGVRIPELAAANPVLFRTPDSQVIGLPSGIALWHATTKKGSLTAAALDGLAAVVRLAHEGRIRGVVLAHDDPTAFCAGADLHTLIAAAQAGRGEDIEQFLRRGVEIFHGLATCPVPVVAAARGVALGGGAELLLHTDAAVFHTDSALGFPERQVGLFPGWMGPAQVLRRLHAHTPGATTAHMDALVAEAFDLSISGNTLRGAYTIADAGLMGPEDIIVAHPGDVLPEAIAVAERLAGGYTPPQFQDLPLYQGAEPLDAAWAAHNPDTSDSGAQGSDTPRSSTDARIAAALAGVLTAHAATATATPGWATYEELAAASHRMCAPLLLEEDNLARAVHLATTGKPLQN